MDLFSTNVLTGTINSLIATPSFLLDTYFPMVQTEQSEEIHFDVISKTRRLAPFVSPVVAGRIVDAQGFVTKTFKPAYIKPKTPFDGNRPFKRIPGEGIGGTLSPQQRMQYLVAYQLLDHKDMVRRRLEVMASEALRTGAVTVSGEQYPTVSVNFGRDAALTVTLAGAARWGQAGIKPLDLLQDWAQLVLQKSGAMPVDVTMTVDVWKVFRADADVIKRIDTSGNTVTIDADSAQTIDGSLTITLAPYESVTLVCPNTGTDWMVN